MQVRLRTDGPFPPSLSLIRISEVKDEKPENEWRNRQASVKRYKPRLLESFRGYERRSHEQHETGKPGPENEDNSD
jgi:hypothetical protein